MKKLITRVCLLVISCVFALTGYIAYFTYKNPNSTIAQASKTVSVDGVGDDIKVELYSRVWHQKVNNPVFAIGELVNKSINYKIAYPQEEVTIDFAIYRMEIETACYYKPGTRNYGKVTKLNKDYTDDCERISYSFIKAAKYGIKVRLIYHREKDLSATKIYNYFQKYMNQNCTFDETKKVSDYLEVRKSQWPLTDLGVNQMHNKQLLISDYIDYDGTIYHDTFYSATSNVDAYNASTNLPVNSKDWSHTGFTISNHEKVFAANLKYFDLTFKYYKNRFEFVDAVMTEHAKGGFEEGGLNYKDECFECYFTPIPQIYTDMYDLENNPYAYYFEKLKECEGQIKCHMNMYHLGSGTMINRLFKTLADAFTNNTTPGNEMGYKQAKGLETSDEGYALLKEITDEIELYKMTHTKDTMLYYGDTGEYVTITGSANLHQGEFGAKSNCIMVFKETEDDHTLYDLFLKNYHETVRDTGYQV